MRKEKKGKGYYFGGRRRYILLFSHATAVGGKKRKRRFDMLIGGELGTLNEGGRGQTHFYLIEKAPEGAGVKRGS